MDYSQISLSNNSIRNPNGIWINSSVFKEEGNFFVKNGVYCFDPPGSKDYQDYWSEQRRRCLNGYTVGGVKITGDHYFYLNFCPIKRVNFDKTKGKVAEKVTGFPDFWDGDFNYFWVREIARKGIIRAMLNKQQQEEFYTLDEEEKSTRIKLLYNSLQLQCKIPLENLDGGYNLIVGKSRRKGYSNKAGAIAACNFFHRPESYTGLGAYDKKFLYPTGIMTMTTSHINFNNMNCAWSTPSDVVNKTDHIRASTTQDYKGVKIEIGLRSTVQAISGKDNPDLFRGKDAYDIFFEEAGAFGTPGLLTSSYFATQDCVMAGSLKTGMITIFGTSGDLSGGTYDYADMFQRPEAFGLLPFYNIWEEDEKLHTSKCGFFHPVNLNMEGFYDEQGNSDFNAAKSAVIAEREVMIKKGATSTEMTARSQEKPLYPSEAFSGATVSIYPSLELKRRLQVVKDKNLQQLKGKPVELYYDETNTIKSRVILDKRFIPITSFITENDFKDKRGCVMVYEQPIPNAPRGLYKIGYDPVKQDTGTSLCAIIVYKGVQKGSLTHSIIVAEWVGRYEDPEDNDRMAEKISDYYNADIMYENEIPSVKNYFRRIKRLNILATQPDLVISKNIENSTVARVYGCHMNAALKDAGEKYIKSWLLTVLDYDENNNPITVIDTICSIRLLEELIYYNRKDNFDLHSALIMCMIQVQEEKLGMEYDQKPNDRRTRVATKLVEMMGKMYKG